MKLSEFLTLCKCEKDEEPTVVRMQAKAKKNLRDVSEQNDPDFVRKQINFFCLYQCVCVFVCLFACQLVCFTCY